MNPKRSLFVLSLLVAGILASSLPVQNAQALNSGTPPADLLLLPTPGLTEAKNPLPLRTWGRFEEEIVPIAYWNRVQNRLHQNAPDQFPEEAPLVHTQKPRLLNFTRQDLGPLELLAEGRSNFAGSPEPRIANIQKATEEKFRAIWIPTDSTFSFVELVGTIDGEHGWKKALNIFKGTQLEYAPGGGVCQASTTIYRAALLAGLPILEQRNHSLYVDYYEAYGSGLDATIFPGVQDLKFLNDTGHPLLLISFIRNDDLFVNLYGTPTGRSVELKGPFTASNESDEILKTFGDLGIGQAVWKYTLKKPGETEIQSQWLISDYMSLVKQVREPIE